MFDYRTASSEDRTRFDYRIPNSIGSLDFHDSGFSNNGGDDDPPTHQQDLKEMGDLITGLRQGKLYRAPIPANPHRILCIGRGFGGHANNIGTQYPDAKVLVVEPWPLDWYPKNVQFCEDNMETRWGVGDNSTCFVHLGSVIQSFSNRLHIYQEAFRILKPGGWIEIVHVGFDLYKNGVVLENEYSACSKRLRLAGSGRNVDPILNIEAELRGCGFTDIGDQISELPIGTWPEEEFLRDIGEEVREKMASDIVRNGTLQDWNTEAMLKLCFSASESLRIVDRAYFNVHTFIAQKPYGGI
ncbi:hypothetical protein IFR05_017181 [Cadophora sp. M221]|nr:hypothetical protein IFR05_017181 [Cadophora sp. M221]